MRKVYRVEEYAQLARVANGDVVALEEHRDYASEAPDSISAKRHAEVMGVLYKIMAKASGAGQGHSGAHAVPDQFLAELRKNMEEAQKLKAEMDEMLAAIEQTKSDIAALHVNALDNGTVSRVSNELDAIVSDTEGATHNILEAAEVIDNNASLLVAALKGDNQGLASDMQEQIIKIYEACNFQDLTGQRINKVIKLLRFIEDRIHNMMDIWGGMETFKNVIPAYSEAAVGDAALLNGPSLATDENVVNQGDIDALFA